MFNIVFYENIWFRYNNFNKWQIYIGLIFLNNLNKNIMSIDVPILAFISAQTESLSRYGRFYDCLFQKVNFNISTFFGRENYFRIKYSKRLSVVLIFQDFGYTAIFRDFASILSEINFWPNRMVNSPSKLSEIWKITIPKIIALCFHFLYGFHPIFFLGKLLPI